MTVPLFTNWLTGQPLPLPITGAKDYGAIGDGVTDDTTALQNAISATVASGGTLYLNSGTYKITSTLNVTNALRIFGSNNIDSVISLGTTTLTAFNITANNSVFFHDFAIVAPGVQTAGAAIFVQPSSGENSGSIFEKLVFNNCWNCIDFEKASNFHVDKCTMNFNLAQFIIVRNTNNADSGDSFITNNLFLNTGAQNSGQTAIYQESSGGLKIIGNKFNGMYRAYWLNTATGIASSDLIFEGNSVENYANLGVLLGTQTPAAAQWRNAQIVGNQFEQAGAVTAFQVSAGSTPTWILEVLFADNVLNINSTGSGGIGVLADFSTTVAVHGNIFENVSGTSCTMISYTANASLGFIGQNVFRMNGAGTTIANASTTTTIDDLTGIAFANLPTAAANGSRMFVTDGTSPSSPLTGGGTGTTAFRQNGAWKGI